MPQLTPEEMEVLASAEDILRASGVYYVHLPLDKKASVVIDTAHVDVHADTLVEAVAKSLDSGLYPKIVLPEPF